MSTSFPKEKIKILLLEGIHPIAKEQLVKAGYVNTEILPKSIPEDELIERLQEARLLGIRSKTQVTENVLRSATGLLAVGCFCIGTNQVRLDVANEVGVPVFNSPYSNTRSVAELVLAECVMLCRGIPEKNEAAHRGEWMKSAKDAYELRGKTLGIIGYGHIGSQVSILAEAFGMKVLYYDIEPKLPLGNAINAVELDALLAESDVVTLHVPATESTANMVDAAFFNKMKAGSKFLNLSRGNVVVIDDLVAALKSEHISGAAVDVYPKEPRSTELPFESPLQGFHNVILTPHIGGSTQEAQYNIGLDVSHKFINYLDKGSSVGSCSIPALNLPIQKNTHRILHIHKNVPGVMSKINSALSEAGANILGQYLKTNADIGYVVLDVNENASQLALEKVKEIEETVKARILY